MTGSEMPHASTMNFVLYSSALLSRMRRLLALVQVDRVAHGLAVPPHLQLVMHVHWTSRDLTAWLLHLALPENHVVQHRLPNVCIVRRLLVACLDRERDGACGYECK